MVLVCRLPTFQRKEIMTKAEEKKKQKTQTTKIVYLLNIYSRSGSVRKKKKALKYILFWQI